MAKINTYGAIEQYCTGFNSNLLRTGSNGATIPSCMVMTGHDGISCDRVTVTVSTSSYTDFILSGHLFVSERAYVARKRP